MTGKFSWTYWAVQGIARLPVSLLTKPQWEGQEHLPKTGGYLVAVNHISEFDSMTFMHYMMANKVPVRVLCKAELFKIPVLGRILKNCGQIRVERDQAAGGDSLVAAKAALSAGECIGIYPEGSLTRDPDLWPMSGKTGCARLALQTRVPLIPIIQWGAQDVLDRYGRKIRLFPRKKVWVKALPALDLSDLYDRSEDPQAWVEATERIMQAITAELEQLRGEKAPANRCNMRDKHTPSKKDLKIATKLWTEKNPKALPSKRKSGELATYLPANRVK